MKKWIAILLAAATLLTGAGCGGHTGQEPDAVSENPPATDSQQTTDQPEVASSLVTAPTAALEQETPRILIAYFTWADMQKLMPELLTSQAVALVTPLYYFGFSAQIKRVIDRFYACSYKLTGNKKVFLMATAYDQNSWTMEALTVHYQTLARYMQWQDSGMVLAVGCGARPDMERSKFPQEA